MKIYKTVKCTKQVLDIVTCDVCKEVCNQDEVIEINHLFGYGTKYDGWANITKLYDTKCNFVGL